MFDLWNISLALNALLVGIIIVLSGIAFARKNKITGLQEQKLRDKELELAFQKKALFEHGLVSVTDTDGEILEVNSKFLGAFGYSRDELIGTSIHELYPDEEKHISDAIRAQTKTGRMWSGETQLLRADGSRAMTQNTVVPLMDDDKKHVKNLSLRIDISRQKIKENQKLVTAAFDKMTDAVVLYDPKNFKIFYMNAFALAEQGWDANEIEGKTLWDTRYVSDRDAMVETCQNTATQGKWTARMENAISGEIYEAHSYRVVVTSDAPRILTMFREVTRNVELERERNRLISIITHELRTPLTSIKGAMGLLDSCAMGPMPSEAKNLVGIALRNSDRMLDLIAQILEAEKAEHEARHEVLVPINMAEAVAAAIASNQGYGTELGITYRDPVGTEEVWINGSERMLEQILANLMSNAAKFSPEDSTVDVWAERKGRRVVLFVRDHGMGVPKDLQPQLFSRFVKTDQQVRSNVHGSGLGLSIVKSQVDRLGGTIDFDTAENVGTCFRISLPLLEVDPEAMKPGAVGNRIGA
ncbi:MULTISPECIES: sensor histidine kinase [Shimia]|uniref:sensor histidine kinase n=1 Tax=Shimia TaxID=573139 RepID=UPI001FB25973|nr:MULTISPECIES: PAS domain-containing sensor histidine kinase [Shimia]MDV4143580.1 PAS domain-containing sensor histidine kinase [Shimia sp. FJ5]